MKSVGHLIDGEIRQTDGRQLDITNPSTGEIEAQVCLASTAETTEAITAAEAVFPAWRATPPARRAQIMFRFKSLLEAHTDELATLIGVEHGKISHDAAGEVGRGIENVEFACFAPELLKGEYTRNVGPEIDSWSEFHPLGVVAGITPFNFPLNLVAHKVGPAIAGGNAVLIKPATDTPLSALKLVEILLEAGLPAESIACITGPGSSIGAAICAEDRIRKISFTGSAEVGKAICASAGLKRVTMELGSNSPLIVLDDADLEKVAMATVATGFANAGQVCISCQRVIATEGIHDNLLDELQPRVTGLTAGDQLAEGTNVGPLVREGDAERVADWVSEAADNGARLLCGGERSGSVVQPALLADVRPDMRMSCDELFGPAVGVTRAANIDEAIALANDTNYGLSAGIFTENLDAALRFAREVESGNLHINWGPMWRADLMPYGGLKDSGMGKEGPKYAIEEMTELKMVIIHR